MGIFLKQSTVSVINFGPILDKTDGVSLETGAGVITSLDQATTGIMISKNGGTLAVREQGANFVATTYDAHGCYKVSLSAVDTNTVGRLRVIHTEPATYLAEWRDFMVLPANVYDSLMGTDLLDVNEAQVLGTAVHASSENGTQCVEVVRWGGNDIAATAVNGVPKVALTHVNAAVQTATLDDIKADTVEVLTRLPDATAGAANGLPIIDATGVKLTKTVDLTAGQSIAASSVPAVVLANSASHGGAASVITLLTPIAATVPDTQKVDVNTIKTSAVTCAAATTILPSVGAASAQTATLDTIKADTAAILVDTGTTLDGRIPAALGADGFMKASLFGAMGTALTETAGLIAAAIVKFFNIATPTGTVNEIKANVKKVNDATLTGNGSALTPWGPA